MKKILLFLLCGTIVASCGLAKKTAQDVVDEKVTALSNLKGATVESVTLEDGLAALKVTFESGILFGFNQTNISDIAKASLDELVEAISDLPESRIRVYGHTDNVGTHEANMTVSARRANEVSKYLQSKGIDAGRLTSKGLAYDDPVADNNSDAGRAKNRRVEIFVIPAQ
ncbi:MAG: OmpA family protein [Bacteroidales bacterium]|nr:OmpA family protein [Bacteroidales bacterium]MBR3527082.1 OmpA family protein [Bacteroidales bacterium]